MSAGCVHSKSSVILSAGFVLWGVMTGDPVSSLPYAVGSLVGIFISPDQDVDNGNISNKIIRNRMGRMVERAWDGLWYFYRKSLKHGSELSHFPVVSTIFRLAYLFFFLMVLPYTLLEIIAPGAWDIWSELIWWIELGAKHYKVILGLMGSDLIHWALDTLTKEHAKQKRSM